MESAGFYIGPPGALIWLPDAVGKLNRQHDERPETVRHSVDGTRRVWRTPKARRTWDVEIPQCEPHEYAALLDLVRWGRPPYVWVDPDAATHNLVPPSWGVGNGGAAMRATDGSIHQRSYGYTAEQSVEIVRGAPVLPGVPVTVSAYIRALPGSAGGYMWAQLLDASGAVIGATQNSKATDAAYGTRVSTTFPSPPVHAAQVRVGQMNAAQVAGIAVTWTKATTSYKPGMGCLRASISDLSDEILDVTEDKGRHSLADIRFRVTEVG